ncbi:alkaline phosphatase D family protein [Halorientalis salina]|uniref:alkaline phosphatase D family protein n=1 Tax=Halorientalis salina TaxID=2932266 RepID=UPI00145DBCEE|nr:alkaline phosphatase D family protein [Halorientalis salina]
MTEEPTPGRRDVLRSIGGVPAGALLVDALGPDPSGQSLSTEALSGQSEPVDPDPEADRVFPQGVASGDPTTDGVVLWTRIDPDAYSRSAPLTLRMAATGGFHRLGPLRSVETGGLPGRDYTVKVDLAGALEPDREYYYQFVYDGVHGPVGRCRTLPRPTASPERVRLGVATCQDYREGYYGAFHHLADEDLDFLLHLGDIIYEWAGHLGLDGRRIRLPSGRRMAWGLEDYRYLHRTYRSDRFFQQALARYAMIATWDDHEIVDNRYWDYEADRPRAGDGAHPRNDDAEFMRQLFADGMRAWWEYMPVRVQYDPDADSLQDRLRLFRSFRFGDLVDLLVTDERLFRSKPDRDPQVDVSEAALSALGSVELEHTMLGQSQREWFADAVTDDATTWTAWANEVLNMRLDTEYNGQQRFDNADAWDGYETERRLLMRYLDEQNVDNFVALTGDLHTALAGYMRVDYDGETDPDGRVGVEFMTPAITSANLAEILAMRDVDVPTSLVERGILGRNPHLEFFDGSHHGYAVAEFTPDACEFTAYAVDKTVDSANASKEELAAFRVPEGEPRLESR